MSHHLISTTRPLLPVAELTMDSPCGPLWLAASSAGLTDLRPVSARLAVSQATTPASVTQAREWLLQTVAQLQQYFAGERREFSIPLAPIGTAFQRRVWQQLLQIPYGNVSSYGELANRLQQPKAARAVGSANGANPIAIMIPCHRVIGKNGTLTGYAWGLTMKQQLLALEQAEA
ncbi:methylated-DNA--[protein]-cysteine S-methyltransferase [Shewanella dokdonensis]|uniref:Methylated-DNA--protein-cysteine methyltransferase n=2 Tax=Shewanella dokdonensis TaxID=712036 RepID=A0ABX8DFU0_9GAMM|nr:methylated-DNA--[protein]-cysteine S-methyltransferase [Shewanella dokdonensis]QVK23588.1 methylated-DNA--[protein]-cysteine S-methyltransferase [Shewanella dokdonensis]